MNILQRLKIAFSRRSALWDASSPVPRLHDWGGTPAAGFYPSDSPETLRRRSEDAFRNSAVARRAVDFLCNSVVGSVGLNPQFADAGIQRLWSRWSDSADFDQRNDWTGLLHLALSTMAVSGECFVLLQIDPNATPVPLSLRLLSPDFLDTSRTDTNTRAGIEYSSDGRRVAYHFFVVHPAENYQQRSVRVPAEDCIHLYRQLAPGMMRGVSWLAPVLVNLKELDEYLTASLTKAKTASLFCGIVRSPEGSNLLASNDSAMPSLEPGSMVRLKPMEDISFSDPPDNSDLYPFVRVMLRRIASGMNLPYSAFGDHGNITFASGRHAKIDFSQHIEFVQYGLLVPQLCLPVMRRWLELARSLELIPDSGEADPRWVGPSLPLLDPQREIAGMRDAIRAGLISRSEAVRRSGWSSEQIDQENARDNERADRLGLVYDSDARKVSQQGQVQQQVSEEVQP